MQSKQIKYVRIHTLQCRGPVEGAPDREVDGTLLSAEEPAHAFDSDHRETGHDRIELWPAFHNGRQCWFLVERGVFRLELPEDSSEPTAAGYALVERALGTVRDLPDDDIADLGSRATVASHSGRADLTLMTEDLRRMVVEIQRRRLDEKMAAR